MSETQWGSNDPAKAALIAAFMDGDDDHRQELVNAHSDVVRERGRVFDIDPALQWWED